jgi:hypothetical protein
MLKPLEQFICDSCGQVIRSKEEGWIEWLGTYDPRKYRAFKIVHHKTASPLRRADGCYHYEDDPGRMDEHLNDFADANVAYNLLFWIDEGPHISPDFEGPFVTDLREWAELTKRLLLPYYEEARFYINTAIADDFIDDPGNPHYLYSVSVLRQIAEKYSEHNAD